MIISKLLYTYFYKRKRQRQLKLYFCCAFIIKFYQILIATNSLWTVMSASVKNC